jgi:hypothetical protein
MQVFNAFICKYHGPTDSHGSRVSITHVHSTLRVYIPFDHAARDISKMAEAYLAEHGLNVVGMAWLDVHGDEVVLLSDTFKSHKKEKK